jgi:hypothetical protein
VTAAVKDKERGGCWHCGVNTPVVHLDIRHGRERWTDQPFARPYALCLPCLGLWFPGWDSDKVLDWLGRQILQRSAWERDTQVRKEADDRHLAGWLASVFK